MFRKKTSRTNHSSFFSKVQNHTVFPIIYMIRIRFFGPGELIQIYFRAHSMMSPSMLCACLHECEGERKEEIIVHISQPELCQSVRSTGPAKIFLSFSRFDFFVNMLQDCFLAHACTVVHVLKRTSSLFLSVEDEHSNGLRASRRQG